MVKLNTLYSLIKKYYMQLEDDLRVINWDEMQPKYADELYSAKLIVQNSSRRLLNNIISEYVASGGKRDISKYCKYYV